ncbi:Outer membrane receptor for ferrienterochelin and colicins [Beggiatoa sp. PS]|nr:Outer membrane receptor for ferrienterochelin and colicins [Beggiatoa sp. PS]
MGMTAAKTMNENEDIDIESLGLSLADLFNLEVTIASGFKQTVARAPAVTSVITAADIEAMGATDLDEVLETVPGLHVAMNNYGNPIYSIRGIYSSFNYEILVLINGIVLKEPWMGDRSQWAGMSVNAIKTD